MEQQKGEHSQKRLEKHKPARMEDLKESKAKRGKEQGNQKAEPGRAISRV